MEASNIICHKAEIAREERNQLNKHRSVIVWFTGLSGSGKSTLAHAVEKQLYELNCRTFVLDGDNIRHGLSSNLGFSDKDRKENIRRIGEVSRLFMEAGVIAITAFISPFRDDRNLVRQMVKAGDFIEIYCNASLKSCESRDVKGLYKRARAGEIKNYTGINSPYEPPTDPDLAINIENSSLEDSVKRVVNLLREREVIG